MPTLPFFAGESHKPGLKRGLAYANTAPKMGIPEWIGGAPGQIGEFPQARLKTPGFLNEKVSKYGVYVNVNVYM